MKIKTGSRHKWVCAVCFLLASLISTPLYAYSWGTCGGNKVNWDDTDVTMKVSTTSFPVSGSHFGLLITAMANWNKVKGSKFNFYVDLDTDGTHRRGNDVNEMYLDHLDEGVLGVTRLRAHCYWLLGWRHAIDEADIAFNADEPWFDPFEYYTELDDVVSIESVALHELGHALGLLHYGLAGPTTMNTYYPNGGPVGEHKKWIPLADDRRGARYLYPKTESEREIVSSVYETFSAGFAYPVDEYPTFAVIGGSISFEYTVGNLGTRDDETVQIGFYLSSDPYWDANDRLLGTRTRSYSNWRLYTNSQTVTIPNVSVGTYYLIIKADNNNAIPEFDETNNAVALPNSFFVTGFRLYEWLGL